MKRKLVRNLLALLLVVLLLALLAAAVFAEEARSDACTVVGGDLTDQQIDEVYVQFGIERGSVKELLLTNAEERALLEGLVPDEKLGKYSISCVFVQLLSEGSGIVVETHNINYCTPEMYQNALRTAGIRDVEVIVSSPFEASGTAALAGVYKAYEAITGTKLDASAKLAGARELTTTGDLVQEIGAPGAEKIISGLKEMITGSAPAEEPADDTVSERIRELAERYNIQLSERQIEQLEDLGNSLENLDINELKEKAEQAKDKLPDVSEAREKAASFFDRFSGALSGVSRFLEKLRDLVSK